MFIYFVPQFLNALMYPELLWVLYFLPLDGCYSLGDIFEQHLSFSISFFASRMNFLDCVCNECPSHLDDYMIIQGDTDYRSLPTSTLCIHIFQSIFIIHYSSFMTYMLSISPVNLFLCFETCKNVDFVCVFLSFKTCKNLQKCCLLQLCSMLTLYVCLSVSNLQESAKVLSCFNR